MELVDPRSHGTDVTAEPVSVSISNACVCEHACVCMCARTQGKYYEEEEGVGKAQNSMT